MISVNLLEKRAREESVEVKALIRWMYATRSQIRSNSHSLDRLCSIDAFLGATEAPCKVHH